MQFVIYVLGLKQLLKNQSTKMEGTKCKNSFGSYLKLILILVKPPFLLGLTVGTPDAPVSKETVKKDSKMALKQLRTLGELVYSNSEFRKLLADANILFRDIFADAASKTADIASDAAHSLAETAENQRPSQDELNNIDNATANEEQQKDKSPLSMDKMKDQAVKVSNDATKKGKEVKKSVQKKGKKTRDDVQEYLSQKFPKQRQDAIVNRLKKVLFVGR
jgi:Family of unknown function (DUF5923)